MGMLDGGVAGLFGSIMGGYFLDATLYRGTITHDGEGGGSVTWADEDCKAQVDAATQAMREAEGFIDTDVRILVLQQGLAGAITTDDELEVEGERYAIMSVGRDPAGAYFELRGRKLDEGS